MRVNRRTLTPSFQGSNPCSAAKGTHIEFLFLCRKYSVYAGLRHIAPIKCIKSTENARRKKQEESAQNVLFIGKILTVW